MSLPSKRTIQDFAHYFGLKIEYRDDLPPSNAGFLDPRDEPQYIAVNSKLPNCEQTFTIAHELGHYVKHHNQPRHRYFPELLDREYQSKTFAFVASRTRRFIYFKFNQEWEADLYAFLLLINIGAGRDLSAYVERHPQKTKLYALTLGVSIVKGFPRIVKGLFLKFFNLLRWRRFGVVNV
jgi:hypothetical protein